MSIERLSVTVATQNMLLDKTRTKAGQVLPQDYRVESMAATLAGIGGRLDVVGIQEAYKSPLQHNGEALASMLGYWAGFWFEHNSPNPETGKGRAGEHVGLFGEMVENARPIELGDRRIAVLTEIAGVAFITTHLRAGSDAIEKRRSQVVELLRAIEDYPDAVLFGDFNETPRIITSRARRLLTSEGEFVSVFQTKQEPEKDPATYPIEEYRDIMWADKNRLKRVLGRNGTRLDGIYVRGDTVVSDAGIIPPVIVGNLGSLNLENPQHYVNAPLAPSDHFGLHATVEIPLSRITKKNEP